MAIQFTAQKAAAEPKPVKKRKAGAGRPKIPNAKVSISIRIDPEILARYRATGPGWQARMSASIVGGVP